MTKYKLSKNVKITGFDEYDIANVPDQYKQGYYILNDKIKDKEYIINATIKYYIEKFSIPKTQVEVLKLLQADTQNNNKELEKTCKIFFDFLCSKNILISEDDDEIILTGKPFYKEGDTISNLSITKILSESQYLDIYLALDKVKGIEYVIKLLNKTKTLDESIFQSEYEDLYKEFTLQKSFKHIPCICKAFHLYKDAHENPFIVLEYIRGKSLSHFLKYSKTPTETDLIHTIHTILKEFSLLHKNKIIHGDIHASNIMISDDNAIKIIDLGLSHWVTPENNEVLIFGGVNFYMPPERINISSLKKYAKAPDFYSDVYQLGLIMYKILYNDLPFDGFVWEELAQNIKKGNIEYPELSFLNYKIPEELVSIIKTCLRLKPEDRFKDASKILSAYNKHVFHKEEKFVN